MIQKKPIFLSSDLHLRDLNRFRWISLLSLGWLLFWGVSWEARLNMDAMTYGVLAKHILTSGDWKTLHYANQAYSDFYQHPPLMIWLTALSFKFFGISEYSARILPTVFALGSVLGTFIAGEMLKSQFCGFLAGIVLLTSTRFIKYGGTLLLDGPLAFWLLINSIILIRLFKLNEKELHIKRTITLGASLGITFFLALMTKGIPALIIPPIFIFLILFYKSQSKILLQRRFFSFVLSMITATALLMIWAKYGNGLNYLQRYWVESVQGRLGEGNPNHFFQPIKSLLKGYWPWIPLYFLSLCKFFRKHFSIEMIPVLFSIAILFGFSFNGFFLEHYLVPFFPFAAITIALFLEKFLSKYEVSIVKFTLYLNFLYALILSTIPLHVQGVDFQDPQRIILKRAALECKANEIKQIYISSESTGLWWGLALGLWYTPWDTEVINPYLLGNKTGNYLLLIHSSDKIPTGWSPTHIREGSFIILQPHMDSHPSALEQYPQVQKSLCS